MHQVLYLQKRAIPRLFYSVSKFQELHVLDLLLGERVDLDAQRFQLHAHHVRIDGGGHVVRLVLQLAGVEVQVLGGQRLVREAVSITDAG